MCGLGSPDQLPSLSRDNPAPVRPTGSCANSHFPCLDSKHVSITPTPEHSINSPISCSKITASSTALMSGLSRALERNSTACNTAGGREKNKKGHVSLTGVWESPGEPPALPQGSRLQHGSLFVCPQGYELSPRHSCRVF